MMPEFGKFGFGFLRLPHIDPNNICDVDLDTTKKMVDMFLKAGFYYFDTAYTYLNGMNEIFLRKALVERYPRDSYMIATKLPCSCLSQTKTAQDIFSEQLVRCGVDYFDVYLLHGLDGEDAELAEKQGCFSFLNDLKINSKARYIGFSFHGTAEELNTILTKHPEVDVVQIQLNYLDWENDIIQSKACYEVCRKHAKPVIVMEPVKGGTLSSIPNEASRLFNGESPAHRALRFAASQDSVVLVLSGMSTPEQVAENTECMAHFKPLTPEETATLTQAADIIRKAVAIPCTHCSYCTGTCPVGIPIPTYFTLYNERKRDGWQVNTEGRYQKLAKTFPPAASCIGCRKCEQLCPQKLPVAYYIKVVSDVYD